jgi:hypothetical protein
LPDRPASITFYRHKGLVIATAIFFPRFYLRWLIPVTFQRLT